jgi:hypothetical protein
MGPLYEIGTSEFDPFRCSISSPWYPLATVQVGPCITRGRGGWLGPTPWKTFTSYPLPAFLAHTALGPTCSGQCSVNVRSTCANSAHQPLMLDYGCRREACERRQGCQIFTA